MTVEQTLAELVAIDSVSSRSNAAIISYLRQRCEARGLLVHEYPHTDENGEIKINLVAQTPAGDLAIEDSQAEACATVELALVGHTDTVPYDPAWTDALRLTEQDGKLFGRGACDTKAFIAAALTAIENFDLAKLKKPLALVFTCDEEIGCLGAKRLAAAKPFAARYAIVGEPTSLAANARGKRLLPGGINCPRSRSPQRLSASGRVSNHARGAFDIRDRRHRRTNKNRSSRRISIRPTQL